METLKDTVKGAGEGVVTAVEFSATWCGPSKKIGPIYEQLAKGEEVSLGTAEKPDSRRTVKDEFKDSIIFLKVDVDSNTATAAECNVQCMPTFQIFFGMGTKEDGEVSETYPIEFPNKTHEVSGASTLKLIETLRAAVKAATH